MTLVGRSAPNFTAMAVMPDNSVRDNFELAPYIADRMAVLFFYTMNFSYICPLELAELNARVPELQKRKTQVVAIGIDSHLSHQWFKRLPQTNGGPGNVQFPIISDMSGNICQGYGILINESVPLRATFIIDRIGVVRHQSVNDFPLGRNMDEIIRIVDAQQHHEKTGEVIPPQWQPGKPALLASPESLMEFVRRAA